jgi:hypothetical protein
MGLAPRNGALPVCRYDHPRHDRRHRGVACDIVNHREHLPSIFQMVRLSENNSEIFSLPPSHSHQFTQSPGLVARTFPEPRHRDLARAQ